MKERLAKEKKQFELGYWLYLCPEGLGSYSYLLAGLTSYLALQPQQRLFAAVVQNHVASVISVFLPLAVGFPLPDILPTISSFSPFPLTFKLSSNDTFLGTDLTALQAL